MKIEQYISQLLFRYQCVTVPGFGAFLTEFQSAQLDENSHSFYPPKKMVSFNPFIKNNDGLLANHLAQAEKIFGVKPDLAVMNYGGIRLPYVKAGPITLGKIYELHPFDNRLVMMQVPGEVVQQFLDLTASKGGWPVAGISMTIQNKKALSVLVGGNPLLNNVNYWVALSDYVATGGDAADMLKPYAAVQKDYLIRNAIIEYLSALEKAGKTYQSGSSKRVQYAE
jgi:2',3'-cyclic-nucleotide 2'-phosphodiesterase (5'-nucleotidase family)